MCGRTPLVILGACALVLDASASGVTWSWSPVVTQGAAPAARQGHASVEVGRGIYVIGGCAQDVHCYNDVHVFDADRLEWRQEAIVGEPPEPRSGHTASLVSTDVFVFGGANSEETFGDVHCLDLVKRRWARASFAAGGGPVPERRTSHAAAVDTHGRIYVFGGYGAGGRFLNDMWILKVSGAAVASGSLRDSGAQPIIWVQQSPTGPVPAAREGHTLTLVDRKLVLFGGYAACGKALNDVHLYDVDAQHWTELQTGGVPPLPRQAHSAVRHGRDVVVAGGCDSGDSQPRCFNDVWALNMIDMQWTQKSSDAATWYMREGHTATFVRGRMFVFGGCQLGSQCYSDVTVLDSFEPCPATCGGHGECVNAEFCRCTVPGFTGHDCMQPLTCQTDCSGHGSCSQNGHCVCDNGWTGADCSVEIPCPGSAGKCSNRGVCLLTGTCQCFTGFTGPDCSAAASVGCPQGCSGHGQCHPSGKCQCHSGWSGQACDQRLAALQIQPECPDGCCGHGCCKQGACYCDRGWYGSTCSLNQTAWDAAGSLRRARLLTEVHARRQRAKKLDSLLEVRMLLASADELEQRAGGSLLPEPQDVALVAMTGSSCASPDHVTTEDFGTSIRTKSFGVPKPSDTAVDCPDKCNFRGLCEDGVCFCQPGYYGPSCGTMKESERNTLSLAVVLAIAGSCLLGGTLVVLALLCSRGRANRRQESRLGFHVSGGVA